jgi:hypothetical protein
LAFPTSYITQSCPLPSPLRQLEALLALSAALVFATAAADWPLYYNRYDGQRFSPLDQINAATSPICSACATSTSWRPGRSTPALVVGDVMYLTMPHTTVARNATTCSVLWRQVASVTGVAGVGNRGAAHLDGHLFRGMPDGSLAALSLPIGRPRRLIRTVSLPKAIRLSRFESCFLASATLIVSSRARLIGTSALS